MTVYKVRYKSLMTTVENRCSDKQTGSLAADHPSKNTVDSSRWMVVVDICFLGWH